MSATTEQPLTTSGSESGTSSEVLRDSVQQSAVTIASCSHAMTRLAAASGSIAEEANHVATESGEIRDAFTGRCHPRAEIPGHDCAADGGSGTAGGASAGDYPHPAHSDSGLKQRPRSSGASRPRRGYWR